MNRRELSRRLERLERTDPGPGRLDLYSLALDVWLTNPTDLPPEGPRTVADAVEMAGGPGAVEPDSGLAFPGGPRSARIPKFPS
jgi:hypothetical protein